MLWRGLDIEWDGVMMPYPEASALVDLIAPLGPFGHAVDIGTGSGCIAIALALEGIATNVDATDIDVTACEVANWNVTNTGANVTVWYGDLYEPLEGYYDLYVFNAPYMRSSEVENVPDPTLAVDGGVDGLDLIRHAIQEYPGDGGSVFALAIGAGHHREVVNLMKSAEFDIVTTGRCPRFGVIRHIVGVRT